MVRPPRPIDPNNPPKPELDYIEGDVLVMFKRDATDDAATKLVESMGLKVASSISGLRIFCVSVPIGEEQKWINEFESKNEVRCALLNRKTAHLL